LLAALDFAAHKHRGQRRKGTGDTPYVNHVIGVAHTLATVGGITDMVTLVAAVLHDTLEDTETTAAELEDRFGTDVCHLVQEVSDDKSLPKQERKRLQVETEPTLSIGPPRLLFEGNFEPGDFGGLNFDVSPDGERFLMVHSPEATTPSGDFRVVLNWTSELERMLPTQ
jgi:hypothetical protein